MKKTFAIMLGLAVVVFLSACGDKKVDEQNVQDNTDASQVTEVSGDEVVDNTDEIENVEDNNGSMYTKESLTIDDLNYVDEVLFPVSYNYNVYKWEDENTSDSWSYTYPENVDHSLLLPIHEDIENREVTSSSIEDGMIYTMVDATLKDGSHTSILYINDPITLQYVAASVNSDTETILYSFIY